MTNVRVLQFEAKLAARKFRKYICVGPLASEEKLNADGNENDQIEDEKVR